MALSLEQVSKKKNNLNDVFSGVESKSTRPWEKKSDISESFQGNYAVKRAQEIVENNNKLVQKLRENIVSHDEVLKVETYIEEREKSFSDIANNIDNVKRIKTTESFFKRMKDSFLRN